MLRQKEQYDMALILNIDTALETGSVSLARDGAVLARSDNEKQQDHASWLHTAIAELFTRTGLTINQLEAVAVTSGPGSYTGIRVGMASAKGLAYALKVPLITRNTLQVMTQSLLEYNQINRGKKTNDENLQSVNDGDSPETKNMDGHLPGDGSLMYCPMIDARRDEVFTAIYNGALETVVSPSAVKLDADAYAGALQSGLVLFFGNGSDKWKHLSQHANARFQKWDYAYFNLAYLSHLDYLNRAFADLAYVEAGYLKEFFTYKKK